MLDCGLLFFDVLIPTAAILCYELLSSVIASIPRGGSLTAHIQSGYINRSSLVMIFILSRQDVWYSPLLIVTHLHLRFLFFHGRILVITLLARPLGTLRAGRVLCSRRGSQTGRWQDAWRRNSSRDTGRSTESGRRRKVVCWLCLLLRLAGLKRRVVLAGHFGERVALLFRVADFL